MELKDTFSSLRKVRAVPCLTLLMPTHRLAPDNAQDKLALKNLIADAKEELDNLFNDREIRGLLTNLDQVYEDFDPAENLYSLAIFVSNEVCEVLRLAVDTTSQIVIEDNFATRILMKAMTEASAYYVVTLSEKNTRLIEANMDRAHESHLAHFPLPNKHHQVPHKHRDNFTKEEDNQMRDYFHEVDNHLDEALKVQNLPIVVAASEHALDNFRHVSRHSLLATVSGNFENSTAAEIGKVAWEAVEAAIRARRQELLGRLGESIGAQKAVLGLEESYAMATQGRGDLLLIESDFHQSATVIDGRLSLSSSKGGKGFLPDAADEIAETVMAMGGQVCFMAGELAAEHRSGIALLLRY
ncbi:MAG: hypothetical protein U0176_27160 [Bacteroidia bacterium]